MWQEQHLAFHSMKQASNFDYACTTAKKQDMIGLS